MSDEFQLPPGQQPAARNKWPLVGEPTPATLPTDWSVEIGGLVERPQSFSLNKLRRLAVVEQDIDIHCVTRWSKPRMRFSGVPLSELLELSRPTTEAKFVRFESYSPRAHDTSLPVETAIALGTLAALDVEGAPISAEHGGPIRVVVPNRYFYKSLKWLKKIEFLDRDRLGFWEREAGYHNEADPWREQRYLAPSLPRLEVRAALKSRDFSGRSLRSMDCRGHELSGLRAAKAILRDADFRECRLTRAAFNDANLTNAKFAGADLRGASFVRADLEGADFAGADVCGCDFRGASLFGASFRSTDDARPTKLDAATKFDAESLDRLMPLEAQFLQAALSALRS